MGKKTIGILLLSVLLVVFTACEGLGGGGGGEQQLVEVTRGDLKVVVSGSGSIEVSEEASLGFGAGGKIKRLYVEEGDEVGQGKVLAELDTSALELALNQAIVARDEAQYNLDQLRDVLHASSDRIELTEEQVALAEQAVAEARKQLDEAKITAPFAGVVANLYADEGDFVTMGQPLIHLIDMNSLELVVEVDEVDIAGVVPGQRAEIEVDALPDVVIDGKIMSIAPLPTAIAGVVVYNVKIGIDDPAPGLRVGMSATADIILSERNNVLLLPTRAVTKDSSGNQVVQVKVGEEIEERTVVTGLSDGLDVEILEGLAEGDMVVIEQR